MQSRLVSDVKRTVEKYRMFEQVRKAVVAFSGGADSVCLLHVLHRLYKRQIQFNLMYVNHGLRAPKVLQEEENLTRFIPTSMEILC